ncbi:MAG: hypothetical protein J6A69_07405 [Clostridia bacterium]|nr:hypothetical protein [Clostridia bacterium]
MKSKITNLLKENKKILILICIGITLIFIGNMLSDNNNNISKDSTKLFGEKIDENKLERILSNIQGAGNVNVFITYENKGVTRYAFDTKTNEYNGGTNESKHVFSNKEPVINSYINPQVRGVIITATGAGDTVIKNNILKAVKAVTGVGYDRISVEIGVK